MSFTITVGENGLSILSEYVLEEKPSDLEALALGAIANKYSARINNDDLEQRWDELSKATERPDKLSKAETIIAMVARAILQSQLEDENGDVDKKSMRWISANVTASANHIDRCRAIWRSAADLFFNAAGDKETYTYALKSAAKGESLPIEDGIEIEEIKKEGGMIDPVPISQEILQHFAFNPAGLPPRLREAENQQVYLDAVVTALSVMRIAVDKDEAVFSGAVTAALLLLDGHTKPTDSRFYTHVQKAVAELSGPAVESSSVQIDGHRIIDGDVILSPGNDDGDPLTMSAPNAETQRIVLFSKAYQILERKLGKGDKVFLQSFAVAARKAVDTFSEHGGDTTLMTPTVDAAYAGDVSSGGSGGGGGVANVDLPPLNDPAGYNDEIERENVRAVSTIYVSYQLEFAIAACARVLELFVAGLLPIPASDGSARALDNLYWDQDELLDEASRRSIYARVLGAPGGELAFDIQPNTEFNTLLMRAVSAISEYEREQSALTHFDNAARGRRFQTTSGEFVRKSIRDFAANVSLRGWAGTAFTAERMAKQITRVMKILSLPAVRNAYGVTTPWQVVERVSQREFGVTVNTVLHRTLAVETQRIMGIIADNHTVWSNSTGGTRLFAEHAGDHGADLSHDASRGLIIAAQHFRAVTGIGDARLEEYSEPVETHASPSLPDAGGMMGGMGGVGGMAGGIDMTGVNALRDLVNSGNTPSPDQILSMLPRI